VLRLLRALHRFKSGDLASAAAGLRAAGEPDEHVPDFYRSVGACLSGLVAFWSGQPSEEHFARAAQIARADNNDLGELYAVGYLAALAARNGQRERAVRLLRRADALAAGDAALHFVAMAAGLGRALLLEQASDLAGALEAATAALRVSRAGAGLVELTGVLATVGRLRAANGDTTGAQAAEQEARRLSRSCCDIGLAGDWLGALSQRLAASRPPAQVAPGDELSERELEVLRMLPTGLSVKGLSDALFVSPNTVKTHLRNIFRKLDVASREAAVVAGRSAGLL
jgi:LuxR family maltose regulon positive regulatory protein